MPSIITDSSEQELEDAILHDADGTGLVVELVRRLLQGQCPNFVNACVFFRCPLGRVPTVGGGGATIAKAEPPMQPLSN